MNTPETINIEKYAEALNNLVGMDIGYLGDSDENVNAIVEVIVAAKKLENRVKELEAEIETMKKDTYTTEEVNTIREYERRTAMRECESRIKELEKQLEPFKEKQCFTCFHLGIGDDHMPCYACRDYDKYEWLGGRYNER